MFIRRLSPSAVCRVPSIPVTTERTVSLIVLALIAPQSGQQIDSCLANEACSVPGGSLNCAVGGVVGARWLFLCDRHLPLTC